jgi:DNA-binding beta-propeller fold protein YncE
MTGTLVVLNKQGDDASFVDLASGRVVATVPTGVGPHELVVSTDGRIAVGTDYEGESASLTVLDIPGTRVARTIDLSPYRRPHGIAFLPGDSVVAVTVEQDRAVLLVRVSDGEITFDLACFFAGPTALDVAAADGGSIVHTMEITGTRSK